MAKIVTNTSNISFANRLNDMLVKQDTKFDVLPADTATYEKGLVYCENGQQVTLGASKNLIFLRHTGARIVNEHQL